MIVQRNISDDAVVFIQRRDEYGQNFQLTMQEIREALAYDNPLYQRIREALFLNGEAETDYVIYKLMEGA